MGTKFKEVNKLSFIGNIGRMTRLSFKFQARCRVFGFDLEH